MCFQPADQRLKILLAKRLRSAEGHLHRDRELRHGDRAAPMPIKVLKALLDADARPKRLAEESGGSSTLRPARGELLRPR